MVMERLISALAAIFGLISAIAASSATSKHDGGSITIWRGNFYIMDHAVPDGFENYGYPSYVNYGSAIGYGDLIAVCDNYTYPPMDTLDGPDCPATPARVPGVEIDKCQSPSLFEHVEDLEGITWSIIRYGKRFVEQFNVPDPKVPDKVYVACYEFNASQFECTDLSLQWKVSLGDHYPVNLTAAVGQICPSY